MNEIKQQILTQANLTVVCAGDSQTWGQGAAGWRRAMPDFIVGEKRRLPDSVPSYVAMLGRYLAQVRAMEMTTKVINSGVGSTSAQEYSQRYWQDMVLVHKPDVVTLMFAINDWIRARDNGLSEYTKVVSQMANDVFNSGGQVIMITQSPILGRQYNGKQHYDEYIEACRQVARADARIRLADANLRMKAFLADGDANANSDCLYEDKWHVAQAGHFIYLKTVTDVMGL